MKYNFFGTQILLRPTKMSNPKFVRTQIFFRPNKILDQQLWLIKFFGTNFFLDPNLFGSTHFYNPIIFFGIQNFSGTKLFRNPYFFGQKILSDRRICCDQNTFRPTILQTQMFLGPDILFDSGVALLSSSCFVNY